MRPVLLSLVFFALAPVLSAHAQGLDPDRWNGVVPEGAAGFSAAIYFDSAQGVAVNLNCAGRGRGLGVFVQDTKSPSDPGASGQAMTLRLAGRDWPVGPGTPAGAMDLQRPWAGQGDLLAAIAAGTPIELFATPPGGGAPRAVATIPGHANDPGYAHVVADCGGGAPVTGPVETRDDFMQAPVAGSWQLRERGENYAAPVAVAWTLKPDGRASGGALGLFCDGARKPAAYLFGYGAPEPDQIITIPLAVDGADFSFRAAAHSTDHVFAVSRRFVAAIGAAQRLSLTTPAGESLHVDLSGAQAALAHAYGDCDPAPDF